MSDFDVHVVNEDIRTFRVEYVGFMGLGKIIDIKGTEFEVSDGDLRIFNDDRMCGFFEVNSFKAIYEIEENIGNQGECQ